jgi:hypothetical protein
MFWCAVILLLIASGLFFAVVACNAQTVTGTEFRFTGRTAPSAIANRYRLFINSSTGQLGCITPTGGSCLVLSGGAVAWGSITGIPSTFPPSAHTHSGGDINTGIVSSLYGGTGFTTTPVDTILIGAGTGGLGVGGGWNQTALCNGIISYNTTTKAITCPTIASFSTTTPYTFSAVHTYDISDTTPGAALIFDIAPSYGGTPGNFNSHAQRMCGSAYDGATLYHPCWHIFGNTTSNAGGSMFALGFRLQDINSWDDAFLFNRDHSFQILPATADSTCSSGQYWLMPNSTTTTWRKCTNGVITDLGSGGGGGSTATAGVTQQYVGFCSGTASSSSTIAIPPFGTANATSCSSSSTTNEVPMEFAGTIRNLRVQSGTAGVNASSSGVISVYKNGVAQGMTCTIGTTHNCNDLTHTFTVNAGDTIGIRMGTAASETLAGVRVSFEDVGGGFGFNNRGAWAATTVYNPYDVVQNTNAGVTSTYVNNQSSAFTSGATFGTGTGEVWTLMASGGSGGGTFTGGTLTSKLTLAPSTATGAMFNLGPGSVTVTSGLTAGDAWLNSSADFQWYNGSLTRTAERTDRKNAASGYAGLDASSLLACAQLPALTGGVTTTAGSCATTLRALVSGDIPNNAANTTGTAANLSGTPALPNGTTATTQTAGDNSGKLATTSYVATAVGAATAPGQTFYGYCSGTATASATLVIPPFGGAGATSCTSTTTTFEQPILQGGVAQTFKVQVETAGVNASSGVFTVYKNGVATAITCTTGTATTCNDTTHTATFAAGDTMGIRFTTQAAETLAKVHVAILVK